MVKVASVAKMKPVMTGGRKNPSIAPMLAAVLSPNGTPANRTPSPKQLVKEHAQGAMRRATEAWVDGHITTKEHNAVHARGKHVLSGKSPAKFRGASGERKIRGLR